MNGLDGQIEENKKNIHTEIPSLIERVEELQAQVELQELGLLLHSIFEGRVASTRQVAKWFHAVGQRGVLRY